MKYSALQTLFTLAFLLLLSACSGNSIYRSNLDAICSYKPTNDCAKSAVQVSAVNSDKEYHLAFVEYD